MTLSLVTALGVYYDTVSWEWSYDGGKMAIILVLLSRLEASDPLSREEMESLAGKLNAVKFLVNGGRFYMSGFYELDAELMARDRLPVSRKLREPSKWWRIAL